MDKDTCPLKRPYLHRFISRELRVVKRLCAFQHQRPRMSPKFAYLGVCKRFVKA